MTRRLQLLDPESRSSGRSVSAMITRIRDGLLRDNKVVPAVLGVLALLIFAWLVAGALLGGGPGEEEQQASNQASLVQGNDSDSRGTETPAPGVENRDSDASYGGYDEGPKDPFRQLIPKAGEEDDNGGQEARGGREVSDRDSGGSNGGRSGNGRDGDTGSRSSGGDGDEDFLEQRSPGGSGPRNAPGGGGDQGSANQDGSGQAGESQDSIDQGDAGQAVGGGGLFNSGGDLPVP